MSKLYLDGCSFTYGTGLQNHEKMRYLFEKSGYEVIDKSRPGKSNMAICVDTHNTVDSCDVAVLGFTFSSRFYIKFDNTNIDILPSRYQLSKTNNSAIEEEYGRLHKSFYTLYDKSYWDNMSDMLVDSTIDSLKIKNKKFFVFSWESRKLFNSVFRPIVFAEDRLEDGHLNANGTLKLFNIIQNSLGAM